MSSVFHLFAVFRGRILKPQNIIAAQDSKIKVFGGKYAPI